MLEMAAVFGLLERQICCGARWCCLMLGEVYWISFGMFEYDEGKQFLRHRWSLYRTDISLRNHKSPSDSHLKVEFELFSHTLLRKWLAPSCSWISESIDDSVLSSCWIKLRPSSKCIITHYWRETEYWNNRRLQISSLSPFSSFLPNPLSQARVSSSPHFYDPLLIIQPSPSLPNKTPSTHSLDRRVTDHI